MSVTTDTDTLLDLCERELDFLSGAIGDDETIKQTEAGEELMHSLSLALVSAKRLRLERGSRTRIARLGFVNFDEKVSLLHMRAAGKDERA